MDTKKIGPAIGFALAGALLLAIGGHWVPGYMLDSNAAQMAKEAEVAGATAALAPVCAEKFQMSDDFAVQTASLGEVTVDWRRTDFIKKGGWATFPDSDNPNSKVAKACALLLKNLTPTKSG